MTIKTQAYLQGYLCEKTAVGPTKGFFPGDLYDRFVKDQRPSYPADTDDHGYFMREMDAFIKDTDPSSPHMRQQELKNIKQRQWEQKQRHKEQKWRQQWDQKQKQRQQEQKKKQRWKLTPLDFRRDFRRRSPARRDGAGPGQPPPEDTLHDHLRRIDSTNPRSWEKQLNMAENTLT